MSIINPVQEFTYNGCVRTNNEVYRPMDIVPIGEGLMLLIATVAAGLGMDRQQRSCSGEALPVRD